MRPKIGITLDWQEKGSFSTRPHYALRVHYFDAVYKAGGMPVAISYISELIDDYIDQIDALILPGGDFALKDQWYENNENPHFESSPRLDFDIQILKKALDKKIPVLGICAGMQIMAGAMGCKLTSDLHKYYDTDIDHLEGASRLEYAHDVEIQPDTLLSSIIKEDKIPVNSAHTEAVVSVIEDNVKINAIAPDGVIEGIELQKHDFALGVQWHPEFFTEDGNPNFKLFEALIQKARK